MTDENKTDDSFWEHMLPETGDRAEEVDEDEEGEGET